MEMWWKTFKRADFFSWGRYINDLLICTEITKYSMWTAILLLFFYLARIEEVVQNIIYSEYLKENKNLTSSNISSQCFGVSHLKTRNDRVFSKSLIKNTFTKEKKIISFFCCYCENVYMNKITKVWKIS